MTTFHVPVFHVRTFYVAALHPACFSYLNIYTTSMAPWHTSNVQYLLEFVI